MKLWVYLGTTGDCFSIDLHNNLFVNKWLKELRWCLDNCEFNQQEAFASLLSLPESADLLEQSIVTINKYLPNAIETKFPVLNQTQDYFNSLHEVFERLSGGYNTPTRLWTVAPSDLKQAIRNLNFFVHRVESKKSQLDELYISFNKDQYRRFSLDLEDYKNFEFALAPGTLFLHYAELGKEFLDLFEDNLPIDYANFKNLHYYSGEATLTFDGCNMVKNKGFFDWIRSHGYDPTDRALGHGRIPLGTVTNIDHARTLLHKHRHLEKILIEE